MDWELERGKKTNGWKSHGKQTQSEDVKRVYIRGRSYWIPSHIPEDKKELYIMGVYDDNN